MQTTSTKGRTPQWRRSVRQAWWTEPRPSWMERAVARPQVAKANRQGRCRMAMFTLLAVLALAPYPAPAAPETGLAAPEAGGGSLFLKAGAGYRVATRLDTDIELAVSGLTVRATLRQSYRNDGSEWVEGVYVFPLPMNAAVDRMRLVVGDRVIEGEIHETRQAAARYEKARQAGKKASLVRQQRANLFTTAVANIGPGETVTVEIGYLDTVRFDEGIFSLRVPMTFTPRYIPGNPLPDRQGSGWSPDTDRVPDASLITPPMVADSRGHRVTLDARINAGLPLEFIASRYHPVDIGEEEGVYRVGFALEALPMDHDLELLWRPLKKAEPRVLSFTETVAGQPHLLVMLMPPGSAAAPQTVPPREAIFVIDTSGSMHGVSIEQARKSLMLALDGLRPGDRFNVIQFNSVTRGLFADSAAASADNVARARSYVNRLDAEGGTEMRPALMRALSGSPGPGRLRQVIFITDGSVGNEAELFELIRRRLGDARLFTVGIGSAPNGWFMEKAAEAGRGTFVTISALHEVEEKMGRLFRKIERPMVTDIEVEWPSDLAPKTYPNRVPDLYAGEPVVIKARLARAPRPGDQLVIRGRLSGGDWGAELPLAASDEGRGIAAVWARAHIAHLLDRERRGEDAEALRPAVLETALRHRLVSKYTSLVAVDKTPVRPATDGLSTEQVPGLLPYGQSMEAIFGFPATATIGPVYRRNGAILLGIAALLLLYQVWTLRGRGHDKD